MYIINPWFFYLVDVIPKIGDTLCTLSLIVMIASMIMFICFALDGDEEKHIFKKYLFYSIITLIISILIPTEETIYKMGIASITTTDNIKIAVTESKELYNFLKEEIADAAKFIIDYQKGEGEKDVKDK